MKNLDDWLEDIQQTHPKDWDLGLDRVGEVARRLEVTHPAQTCILVAGTNGKGSTCEFLAGLCRSSNRTYGKTTSPFFHRYNEQIEINGQPVSDEELVTSFEVIAKAAGEISLSYFEYGALAAMLLFQQAEVEVGIFEIGLGGRLDAMNVIEPDASVITRIALDHQDWLGDSRELIGFEKAGVMRAGKPVVILDEDVPMSVLGHGVDIGAKVSLVGRDFQYDETSLQFDGQSLKLPPTQLPLASAVAAIMAMATLGIGPDQRNLERALSSASLPGRFQVLAADPFMVLDVCHNPDAASYLCKKLQAKTEIKRWHLVLGIYKDKDHSSIFQNLAPLTASWYFADLGGERGAQGADLALVLDESCGLSSEVYDKVPTAFAAAENAVGKDEGIAVLGSFATVSAVLEHLGHKQ